MWSPPPPWRSVLIGMLGFGLSTGCILPSGPDAGRADLLVVGLRSGRLLLVNTRGPTVVGEIGLRLSPLVSPSAVASDAQWLFLNAQLPDESSKLIALSLRERRVLWMLDLATRDSVLSHNGVKLLPGWRSAPTADGRKLFMARALRGDTLGIAVLDVGRREVADVIVGGPPFRNLLVVAGASQGDSDLLAAWGNDSLYLFRTAPPFELTVVSPPPPGSRFISNLSRAPGRSLYVAGDASVGLYDLATLTYRTVVPWQVFGGPIPSPDGSVVVGTGGGGDVFFPATGLVPVLGPNLETVAVVDLRSPSDRGGPLVVASAAFSLVFPELYLGAGTDQFRSDFTPQPARIVIVDRRTWSVRATLYLQDWGVLKVFPLP